MPYCFQGGKKNEQKHFGLPSGPGDYVFGGAAFPSAVLSAQVSGLGISLAWPRQMAETFAASSIQWDRADFVPCLLLSDYLQYRTQSSQIKPSLSFVEQCIIRTMGPNI